MVYKKCRKAFKLFDRNSINLLQKKITRLHLFPLFYSVCNANPILSKWFTEIRLSGKLNQAVFFQSNYLPLFLASALTICGHFFHPSFTLHRSWRNIFKTFFYDENWTNSFFELQHGCTGFPLHLWGYVSKLRNYVTREWSKRYSGPKFIAPCFQIREKSKPQITRAARTIVLFLWDNFFLL